MGNLSRLHNRIKSATPYMPSLNAFSGSVTATLLAQQACYRFEMNGCKPFYKFKTPCSHNLYAPGDSWEEELGFSRKVFDKALSQIGQKLKAGQERDSSKLIWYWTDMTRATYYDFNLELFEAWLSGSAQIEGLTENPQRDFTKIPKGTLSVNPQRDFSIYSTEYNQNKSKAQTNSDSGQNTNTTFRPDPKPKTTRQKQAPSTQQAIFKYITQKMGRKVSGLLVGTDYDLHQLATEIANVCEEEGKFFNGRSAKSKEWLENKVMAWIDHLPKYEAAQEDELPEVQVESTIDKVCRIWRAKTYRIVADVTRRDIARVVREYITKPGITEDQLEAAFGQIPQMGAIFDNMEYAIKNIDMLLSKAQAA